MCTVCDSTARCAAILTAAEACLSDLCRLERRREPSTELGSRDGWFWCGNFGLILLNGAWAATPEPMKDILQKMAEVTMVRGAQSGGVLSYVINNNIFRSTGSDHWDLLGLRARVVNQKRTCLSELLRTKLDRAERWAWLCRQKFVGSGRLYVGHTRFATSSKSTLDGAHPHQWSPPQVYDVYTGFSENRIQKNKKHMEIFVTHNGDFDFFEFAGPPVSKACLFGEPELTQRHGAQPRSMGSNINRSFRTTSPPDRLACGSLMLYPKPEPLNPTFLLSLTEHKPEFYAS